MKYLMWLLKAAIFFTLFAFALNNQQTVAVHFFFGTLWQAPLVLVVLVTFSCGLSMGILVMTPRWWKNRKMADSAAFPATATATATLPVEADSNAALPHHGI